MGKFGINLFFSFLKKKKYFVDSFICFCVTVVNSVKRYTIHYVLGMAWKNRYRI